jgi:hypothetical protein
MTERATVIRYCIVLDILRRFDTDISQALGFEEFSSLEERALQVLVTLAKRLAVDLSSRLCSDFYSVKPVVLTSDTKLIPDCNAVVCTRHAKLTVVVHAITFTSHWGCMAD